MIIKFNDSYLEKLSDDKALLGKQEFPEEVIKAFKKRIFQLKNAKSTFDLKQIKSFNFEKLKEKRYAGKFSIRLNKSYRLIFGIDKQGAIEVIIIDEISNHYS